MKTPLQVISGIGCPTSSINDAIRYFSEREDLTEDQYLSLIQEIIGLDTPPVVDTYYFAKFLFLYVVQETIKAHNAGLIPDMDDLYASCVEKAKTYIENNPWSVTRFNVAHGLVENEQVDPETGESTQPKSKGAKKDITDRVFLEMKSKGASRQEIIQAFIDQTGMSKAGATTYFHALKKQHGFAENKESKKVDKPESKQQIAERIYQTSEDKSKEVLIPLLEQHLGTSKLGAQTYFYACKKKFGIREYQ